MRRRFSAPAAEFFLPNHTGVELPGVPYDSLRADRILTFLSAEGLVGGADVHRSVPASVKELSRIHTDPYLDSLQEPQALSRIFGVQVPDAQAEAVLDLQRRLVGCSLQATRLALLRGRAGVALGGGFHHALADRGQGFCIFNDVAVAIADQRARGFRKPVLVVDLDLHDGDGTRTIFAADPTVHTFSIHNHHWGPIEAQESTSIALGDDVVDAAYLEELRRTLPPIVERFQPGLVFFLAGCDPAFDDELGNWRITPQGMLERDQVVISTLRRCRHGVALVILLAGGYGSRAWRYSARFLSSMMNAGRPIEPPTTEQITLLRYHYLQRLMSSAELTGESVKEDWGLTEEDLLAGLGGNRTERRFLGYYTRQGVELALARFGILERLRCQGFSHPTIEFDLDNPAGQTVRIFGSEDRTELLMELRVRRDRKTLPAMELLSIEWLLLQNPRARFTASRPPLPGQIHPGLGLLKDVVAMLVLACERLQLDGLVFVPSKYHLAAQWKTVLHFLDPDAEARFRVLRKILQSLTLAQATRAVEEGLVIDLYSGQPFIWQPSPMVAPAGRRRASLVDNPQYEAAVQAATERYAFELLSAR